MKHILTAAVCSATLVASLAACGGSDKAAISNATASSNPSTTGTSQPTMPPTTTATTNAGPVILAAHSTYTYSGLSVVVNLPADIPNESRSSLVLASDFLQALGRTMAGNKLDASVKGLSSPEIVRYIQTAVVPGSVQGIGLVTFTISQVQTVGKTTGATVCVNQSKLVQVRKDGSQFFDTDTNGRRSPSIKLRADINRGPTGPKMARLTSTPGTC